MGPGGSMRSPRGSSAGLRATVGVMLLGLYLSVQSVSSQACSASLMSLNQPQYQNTTKDIGAGFMQALVHSFLHTVQPRSFPEALIVNIANAAKKGLINQEMTKDALMYEIGFLVGAAFGVVYIVLMPLVGFFLACCRCCGNCGGKMYQKQTSSITCRRRSLYWSAFITTIILLAGNICMFVSNGNLRASVDASPKRINNTIDNINTFVTAVPQQVNAVISGGNNVTQTVIDNLDAIGAQLGTAIRQPVKRALDPVLSSVGLLDQETGDISVQLNTLNSSLVRLQSSVSALQTNLSSVRSRINNTLSQPNCTGCASQKSELQKIKLDVSVNVPGLSTFQSAVDEIIKTNLSSKSKEVNDFIDSIPQLVTNKTKDVVLSSKKQLTDIKAQLSQVTTNLPLSALSNVTSSLRVVQNEISSVSPQVEKYEFIRWSVCVAICCVVLLVVVCNVLGLVLGPLGLSPNANPTKRSCMSDCGGTFLMMGAGFSFLVSWLFMILVLLLFLLFGNVYTLVCEPWNNNQLLKFIETSGFIQNLDLGKTLGLKTSLNISTIYTDCENNQPVWTTLKLYELVNLDNLLNVSKYTKEIQQQFDNTNISLTSINILNAQVENQLRNFSSKAFSLDTAAFNQQMNNISTVNLNTTADILDSLAANTTDQNIKNELQGEAKDLRQLQANIEIVIMPEVNNLNRSILNLKSTTNQVNLTVGDVLQSAGRAQEFLNTNTTQTVKNESRRFLDRQLACFTDFANWANVTITQQVGRCQPVAGAVDTMKMILCSQMVESVNAFWFSLGWCLIFFIPSIIFSIKLAKFYRKMKSSDVYEDSQSVYQNHRGNHIGMTQIPRAQVKFS